MAENVFSNKTIDEAIQVVLRSVESSNTKRAYARALNDFKKWYLAQEGELSKALIQAYAAQLQSGGMDALNINQRLTAIRKLIEESADSGHFDPVLAAGILRIKGTSEKGKDWATG